MNQALGFLNTYYGVLILLGGAVFQVLWQYFTVTDHEKRIVHLEGDVADINILYQALNNKMTGIETNVQFLVDAYKSRSNG